MGEVETVVRWSQLGPWVCGAAAGCLDHCRNMMPRFEISWKGEIEEAGIY